MYLYRRTYNRTYSAFDLPNRPLPNRWWVNRIFEHRGGSEDFQHRFSQAVNQLRTQEDGNEAIASTLFDVITDQRNLYYAFNGLDTDAVRGPDGMTFEHFEENLRQRLKKLSTQLINGTYQRRRELLVEIPKPSGGSRQLVIQSIIDRVIDKACAHCLSIVLDRSFSPNSFGFRPKRGCWRAVRKVRSLIRQGYHHWLACDIRNAFGTVSIRRLINVLNQRFPDVQLIPLIRNRLATSPQFRIRGLRPGSPLSPLMLNLYLDQQLDKPWAAAHPLSHLIRYADDLVIGFRTAEEARQSYGALVRLLRPIGMAIKEPEEKAVIDLNCHPLPFLGFDLSLRPGGSCVRIGQKGLPKLQDTLINWVRMEKINRDRGKKKGDILDSLASWLTYFGPAYRWEDRSRIYTEVSRLFSEMNRIADVPGEAAFVEEWKHAYECFRSR